MILVDTSVWVAALRDAACPEAIHLRELLDRDEVAMAAPVRLEILAGTGSRDLRRLRGLLTALPFWIPELATWERLDRWVEMAVRAGERFGIGDLLIAGIAAERGAAVWSLDDDLLRMARLGFVELHAASRSS